MPSRLGPRVQHGPCPLGLTVQDHPGKCETLSAGKVAGDEAQRREPEQGRGQAARRLREPRQGEAEEGLRLEDRALAAAWWAWGQVTGTGAAPGNC